MIHQDCRVLLVEDNAVNALVVHKMLKSVDNPVFHITQADSLVKALEALAKNRFDAALVDLGLGDSSGLETFLAIQRAAPGLAIVVLSGTESDEIAMKAVEQGAQDFLNKQRLNAPELIRSLSHGIIRSRKRGEEHSERPTTTVVGFLGSKGGVGSTSIACHTARELKRQTGEDVLLTGLDHNSAGVSYLMKVAPKFTLSDATVNLHRLDAELWKGFVSVTPDGVDVMAPAGAAAYPVPVESDRLNHVLRFARGLYQHVVLDLGVLNPLSLPLLEDCAKVYLVATEELPALWEAGRILRHMKELGVSAEKLHFVVNAKKKRGLTTAELEKAIGYEIHSSIAECRDEIEGMLASGRFIDAKSQMHRDVSKIVARLLGKEVPAEAPSGFSFSRLVRA